MVPRAKTGKSSGRIDGQVADQAVDDEAGDPAVLRLGRDQVAEHGVLGGTPRIHHDDVAGLRHVERLVDHQVVAGKDLHGASGAAEHVMVAGEATDRRVHGVEPIQEVGDVGGCVIPELVHQARVQPDDVQFHAKSRAQGAGPTIAVSRP